MLLISTILVCGHSLFGQEANPAPIVIDNAVTQIANVLTADAEGYTYQWIDCDNENAEIEGATEQTYTATNNGNYAVVISSDNCSTTSECIEVIGMGIFDNSPTLEAVVYPNPFIDDITIKLQSNATKTTVEVLSITGKVIFKENFTGTENIAFNLRDVAPGTYIVKVLNDQGQYSTPIIKQ